VGNPKRQRVSWTCCRVFKGRSTAQSKSFEPGAHRSVGTFRTRKSILGEMK